MSEEKEFYVAYAKCKKWRSDFIEDIPDEDFEYIHDYITQKHFTPYYLLLLWDVIPWGMLRYRLRQQLKQFNIDR